MKHNNDLQTHIEFFLNDNIEQDKKLKELNMYV